MIRGSRWSTRAMLVGGTVVVMLAAASAVFVVPSAAVDPPAPIAAETLTPRSVFPDEITKEVFNEWQPYREHVSKRRIFNDNDPIKQGVYSEVARQSKSYAAKAVLVVAPRK